MSRLTYYTLLFLLSITPAILGGSTLYIEQKLYIVLIGWLLMLMCSGIYRSILGKIVTFIISALWSLNLSISLFFYREHDIAFSSSIAETFINTNGSETVGMLSYNKYYVLFYICSFSIYYFLIHKSARFSHLKTTKNSVIAMVILIAIIPIYKNLALRNDNKTKLLAEYTLLNTPFL